MEYPRYTFYTKHEADLFAKCFKTPYVRKFNEKVGQTVFIFQW
jgi:hypothetical protein